MTAPMCSAFDTVPESDPAPRTPRAHAMHTQIEAALPAAEAALLRPSPGSRPVPATWIREPAWLDEQIRLRGERWRTGDVHVLATLWWFSASHFLVTPSLAALLVTGRGLDPALDHLVLHHMPDSRVMSSHSAAALDRPGPAAVGEALRASLGEAITAIGRLTAHGDRPLWALATDGISNRLLTFGLAVDQVDRATALAADVVAAMDAPMPAPRFSDVTREEARGSRRSVVRASCCLLYRAPDQEPCDTCPRQRSGDRRARPRAGGG